MRVQVSYRSYWTRVVLQALEQQRGNLSVKEISELTAIRTEDIVKTLESLNLIKYWKVHSFGLFFWSILFFVGLSQQKCVPVTPHVMLHLSSAEF